MLLKFHKEPVVEAWIDFRLDLSQENEEFTEDMARSFLSMAVPEYKVEKPKKAFNLSLHVDTCEATCNSQFGRLRAFSPDETYCVQVSRELFVFNQIKKGRWPGFENLKKKSLELFDKYLAFRNLKAINSIVVHYRDIIDFPCDKNGRLDCKQYLNIYPGLPKEFPDISRINMSVEMPENDSNISTLLEFSNINAPRSDEEKEHLLSFNIDWHAINTEPIEIEDTGSWLDNAHEKIKEKFEKLFTKDFWERFGEETTNESDL